MQLERIIVVKRPTRLEELKRRFNTKSQAEFYVKSRGQSFEDYEIEDMTYQQAREAVFRSIPRRVKFLELDRSFLPNYVFAPDDLVITLGQDGLVVNTAKYLNGQNILAVNPDPERFDGILLPFKVNDVEKAIEAYEADALGVRSITMAKASLNDGQEIFAFNDLFIGPKTHSSARYTIRYRNAAEHHCSSGIIVSTPAGSTGWMSSLYNQTAGIAQFAAWMMQNDSTDMKHEIPVEIHGPRLRWEDRRLVFHVREPFRSQVSQTDIVAGYIEKEEELILESYMPENGVIFSDGMEWDFLQFNSGTVARISVSDKQTNLLVAEKTS
jgi:NAD kinase